MAREYKGAEAVLVRDEARPFTQRNFMLLLLASPLVEFDKDQTSLDVTLKSALNREVGRYALRTQVIGDPTRPLGGGTELLQFFMVDPNRDEVLRGGHPAVLYEAGAGEEGKKGSGEVPLFMLSVTEVDLLVHGEGFSTPLRRG